MQKRRAVNGPATEVVDARIASLGVTSPAIRRDGAIHVKDPAVAISARMQSVRQDLGVATSSRTGTARGRFSERQGITAPVGANRRPVLQGLRRLALVRVALPTTAVSSSATTKAVWAGRDGRRPNPKQAQVVMGAGTATVPLRGGVAKAGVCVSGPA